MYTAESPSKTYALQAPQNLESRYILTETGKKYDERERES